MKRFVSVLLASVMLLCACALPTSSAVADAEPFKDVKKDNWFYDYVMYCHSNGYMAGVGDGYFNPNSPLTRGMFVTILSSIEKYNKEDYLGTSFPDVPESQWYAAPVKWAAENEFVSGYEDGTFKPDNNITRQELALILYKYAAKKYNVSEMRESAFEKFGDKDIIAAWAKEGVTWASSYSIVSGKSIVKGAPNFAPGDNATRAEAATMIKAFTERNFDSATPIGDILLNGNSIKDYTIVYGETASDLQTKDKEKVNFTAEKLAIKLQGYINEAIGVSLPIVKDTESEVSEKEILIGKTNREGKAVNINRSSFENEPDALLYEMQGDYLVFASNEKYLGTHYAVYDFLERQVGFTFFGAVKVIAPKTTIKISSDLHFTDSTEMNYRMNHSNSTYLSTKTELRHDNLSYDFANLAHTLGEFADKDYDVKNYWSYHIKHYLEADPCLSDPEIQQTIIKNVKAYIATRPDKNLVWVTQNDGSEYCKCSECTKFYMEHGRCSTYLNMLNLIGEAIEEDYPDYKVVGLSYKYTHVLPRNLTARDNVIMCVCTDSACSAHAITDTSCNNKSNKNSKLKEEFDGWFKVCENIYVWDYITGDVNVHAPFPVIYQMYDNYKYFHENGVKGAYALAADQQYADFGELKAFLTSKLQWSTKDMTWSDYSKLINDFLSAFYGDGSTYIREYIDVMHELSSKNDWHIWTNNRWDTIVTQEQYNQNFDYLKSLWDKALSLAANEEQTLRIRRSMLQIKYIELVRAYEVYRKSGNESDLDAYKQLNLEYYNYTGTLESNDYELPDNWDIGNDPMKWNNNHDFKRSEDSIPQL